MPFPVSNANPSDRRTCRRYPLRFAIEVRTPGEWQPGVSGTTIDISSQGMAVQARAEWNLGTAVEISVSWPVKLNQACLLKLVVTGEVVRSHGGVTAIRLQRYQFRTRAS